MNWHTLVGNGVQPAGANYLFNRIAPTCIPVSVPGTVALASALFHGQEDNGGDLTSACTPPLSSPPFLSAALAALLLYDPNGHHAPSNAASATDIDTASPARHTHLHRLRVVATALSALKSAYASSTIPLAAADRISEGLCLAPTCLGRAHRLPQSNDVVPRGTERLGHWRRCDSPVSRS
ncbi:hypothetical protein B0H14DRAFT_3904300 [Mycena olivaceomarginata]|nr:hypothetical protein B0H14DRAFT_3904300 [Mycena olivaceomarginata]